MGLVSDATKKWFDELEATLAAINAVPKPAYYQSGLRADVIQWLTDARAALESVFPANHAVMKDWNRPALVRNERHPLDEYAQRWQNSKGVFAAAIGQIRQNRLEGDLDKIRGLAENDVLSIAETLLADGFGAAATVMAGGALEVHLRRLCEREKLSWPGDGSISKYNDAITKARNDGVVTLYEKADHSQVTSWGQTRNEAAHNPAAFKRDKDQVQFMIDGIRQFMIRTP